jgi:hypothetical protein
MCLRVEKQTFKDFTFIVLVSFVFAGLANGQGSFSDSTLNVFSRHHLGLQVSSLLNPIVPSVQLQYLYRSSPKSALKMEAGYLFSPYFKDEARNGYRVELTYVRFTEQFRMWGITIGGRYALHNGNGVRTERFAGTLVDIVRRDNIEMRSRMGGIWYMMGGQFIHKDRWYNQIEFLLGLIVYQRTGLNVPPGERLFQGDSFWNFIQPNEFRARVLPSIRIYYSWGRRSPESPSTSF